MDWNALSDAFTAATAEKINRGLAEQAVKDARQKLQAPQHSDWQWLEDALNDETRKWFVAALFRNYPVPKRLFEPFLRAVIYEIDPDANRQFVLPCINTFGHRKVNERLLDYVEGDDDFEIAGAVAALYRANMKLEFSGNVPEYTVEHATAESRAAYTALQDVWQRKRQTFLRVFVTNDDVTVRQQIIPSLKLDESAYPDEMKPLVQQAIQIARNHPDEYIRHRVEYQLGTECLAYPIPERSKPG